jgi:methylated-DNA-protein-cysteine methyltransferase-like protein
MGKQKTTSGFERWKSKVLPVVAAIPQGCVSTYGAVARHVHLTPRQVAFVLARLTSDESSRLPWFRVVAAQGVISTLKLGAIGRKQIARLREEGVACTGCKVEDFSVVFWSPS